MGNIGSLAAGRQRYWGENALVKGTREVSAKTEVVVLLEEGLVLAGSVLTCSDWE